MPRTAKPTDIDLKAAAKKAIAEATSGSHDLTITIPEIEKRKVVIRVVGDTPLITHCWSEKAKEMMRIKQTKGAALAKSAKNAAEDVDGATYWLDKEKGHVGFPAIAFKASMVDAAVALGGKKTETRRAFRIVGIPTVQYGELVKIEYQEMVQREDMVRVGMGTADLRYRPEFRGWHADVTFIYDARQISPAQIISLLNQAGFSTGIGEWRPERDGSYGMFSATEIIGDITPQ
jgi:hypothetical protein